MIMVPVSFFALVLISMTRITAGQLLNSFPGHNVAINNFVNSEEPSPFQIIIDGGSTGSRLHVFEFVRRQSLLNTTDETMHSGAEIECVRRGSWKAWPALSSFARVQREIDAGKVIEPSIVAAHLVPLFEDASKAIPAKYHAITSVKYQATAGMRLLDEEEQHAVYDALYEGLISSIFPNSGEDFPFLSFKREDIATLGGDLEGLYGAIAANYLSGALDVGLKLKYDLTNVSSDGVSSHGPIGALDMGGSSTQLVFLPRSDGHCDVPNNNRNDNGTQSETCQADTTGTFDSENFYSVSYLSYGVDQFRERLWDLWIKEHETISKTEGDTCVSKAIINPCGFKGHQISWNGYTMYGTGDASGCIEQVQRLLPSLDVQLPDDSRLDQRNQDRNRVVGGIEHPPIRGKFFAMSLYFFALDSLRVLSGPDNDAHHKLNLSWPNPSIEELFDALDGLCSRSWPGDLEEIQNDAHEYTRPAVLPHRCVESVYIVTLLRDGFGFHPSSRDITFTYLLNGSEVEWTLGMALSTYSGASVSNETNHSDEESYNVKDDLMKSFCVETI